MSRSGPGTVPDAGLTTPGGQNTPAPAATTSTGQDRSSGAAAGKVPR
jgi:hypothetical protein